MTLCVEMTAIDKHFAGVHALKKARFDLHLGEVHALMGENGAGKSTLMKILSGIYQRDAGQVKIFDKATDFKSPRQARASGIGMIHQELSLMNDLTAGQNIFIGHEPRLAFGRLDEAKLNKAAKQIFADMKLNIDPKIPVDQLSIAKQQMIEIAKALSQKSRILIMDEPTAALNDAEIADLFVIIDRLRLQGVGIIYISHKMDELKKIADRVTVMRDGETIKTLDVQQTPVQDIITLMVGRTLSETPNTTHSHNTHEIALSVKNLSRGKEIKSVNFSLKRGEILGFAGLMGAGRTEVARAIFGADPKDHGTIAVYGKNVIIQSPFDAVKAGIGYLSEDRKHFGLATEMDVRANIVMTCLEKFTSKLQILNESAIGIIAQKYIKMLGIRTPSDRQQVRLLSGGNQQKVVIAKWLLRASDILIFDEPTRGIDVGAKAEIYNLLNELAAQGRAIIVISSELPEILRVSHRIAVMREGRLNGILSKEQATQEAIMALAT